MPPGWETNPSKTHHCPKHGNNCVWDRKAGYCKAHQYKCRGCGWSVMLNSICMTCKTAVERQEQRAKKEGAKAAEKQAKKDAKNAYKW